MRQELNKRSLIAITTIALAVGGAMKQQWDNTMRDFPSLSFPSMPLVIPKAEIQGLERKLDEENRRSVTTQSIETKRNYSLDDYIGAMGVIESNNNPNAERYERHLDDWSYGTYQILTRTAKGLEDKYAELPRLGNTPEEIEDSLKNHEINRKYATIIFNEEMKFYKDPFLAVAAYNAGHLAPRNARIQEQLNDLYNINLATDGSFGEKSRDVIERFQRDYGLEVDGKVGPRTYSKLQDVWQKTYSGIENPIGIIPNNNRTPHHVERFREELEN